MPTIHASMPRPALLGACVAAALSLAGCGNSDIKTVQNTAMPDDAKITIGKVLKDRKACDKNEWDTHEDSRGQKFVSYKCYFSVKELNREQKSKRERFIAEAKTIRDREQARLKALEPEIKAAEKKLQPLPKDKEPDLAALEKTPYFTMWRKAITQMDVNAGKPYDAAKDYARMRDLLEFFMSEQASDRNSSDPKKFVGFVALMMYGHQAQLYSHIQNTAYYYDNNKARIENGRTSPKTDNGRDDYAYYQKFSGWLHYAHDNLPKVKAVIEAQLDKLISDEKAKTEKENAAARRPIDNANRPIQREIDRLTTEKERLTQKLASYGKDFEKQLKTRAEQEHPNYDAVFEGFAWEIDRQGRPTLKEGGLVYQSRENGEDFRRYVRPDGILNRIAKFDAKDFANYRQELGRVFVR